MASAKIRRELECSICMDMYTDPVNLACGHNFCRDCIDRVLDSQMRSGVHSCPECRTQYPTRPTLQRNITLCNIVDNFLPTQPDQEETGVFCTYCVDYPELAVKACLHCEVSLCDKHLTVHKTSVEHVLTSPTASLEERKCSIHKELLRYFCTEDSACICLSCCLIGEHRGHHMEPLFKASERKKKQLRNALQKLMIKKEEMEGRVQNLHESRRKLVENEAGNTERVSALFRDLKRHLEDLEKRVLNVMSRVAQQLSLLALDLIQQLETKKDELSRKMSHIEELCNMTDPLTVLQKSDSGDLFGTKYGDNEDKDRCDQLFHDGGDLEMPGIPYTLHTGLSDITIGGNEMICIQEPDDILLDVNTAGNNLHISDDKKTASWSSNQNLPETPERFQYDPQVLSSHSFSSGRHYWEVDVGGSQSWSIGMCYPSMDRRGEQSWIGYNKKSWGLESRRNQCSVIHDSTRIPLPTNIYSDRIRIYLDYEAGQISFYDLCDPIRHLHTFTTTFDEPLHAVLGVGLDGCIKITG
ncbi:PREDICTED: E3 ubiquitin-protein ligase TRIM39-like [Nanorana parkeri]|uniref:E3 ubiquitin-protein ligase TRIM39-like n=1 Tax=Nanorana parkeri TaxID=125878 RepID=UPI00085415AE|nr:PREDICTED: E3 ubiquitin-protein ligase TRIM39-like [Nanorana parkeri]